MFRIRVSHAFVTKITAAILIFFISYVVMSSATGGDIYFYQKVYNDLPDYGLIDGFWFYYTWISSTEYVHYLLVWVVSRIVDHNTFVSLSNAVLAYVTMSVFQKWKASFFISYFIVLTNFYFYVMYFSTERLKIGFIFLALSFLYSHQLKKVCGFAFLAFMTHIQTIMVYISLIINRCYALAVKFMKTGKTFKYIIVFPLFVIPLLFLREQIFLKFYAYYHETEMAEFVRIVLFFVLAMAYSRRKLETILLFFPIVIGVFLFGGDRVNFLGYFIFLYYGLQFRKGWNVGVLVTSAYFAYATIGFCVDILGVGI
jgi:hypothetical protein